MIRHVVVWTMKESANGATKAENMRTVKSMLDALPTQIPQIRRMEVGFHCTGPRDAADIALVADFDTPEDLQTYQDHPAHQKVVEFLRKVRDTRLVVDYSVTDNG